GSDRCPGAGKELARFEVRGNRVDAEGGPDVVEAFARLFGDLVAGILEDVDIVALAAGHLVIVGAALEPIAAVAAEQRIVAAQSEQEVLAAIAGDDVVEGSAGQGRILNLLARRLEREIDIQ